MLQFFIIMAGLIIAIIANVEGESWTCKGEEIGGDDEEDWNIVEACHNKSEVERNQTGKSSRCVALCYFNKLNVVNEEGKYSSDGMETYTKRILPSIVHANVTKETENCAKPFGNHFAVESNCTDFRNFLDCYFTKVDEFVKRMIKDEIT